MDSTYRKLVDELPAHLKPFVKAQDYSRYSPKDHTAWRVLLRLLTRQLSESAHPVYLEGMEKTGITLDRIPTIEGMNKKLAELGWAAVVVDGFIPPAIFMEFQARRILPIAQDMRAAEHLLYTPAPDIVHEAAGHAPFIVDSDYAEFLQQFGEVGMKALSTHQDQAVYEAIRHLSIVKEFAAANAEDVRRAEQRLQQCIADKGDPSEASLLSRLHWWTVEYGLVGSPMDYRLFGAGLLSSLGESRHCLDDLQVKKHRLTPNCVQVDYDITSEQPQLFVAASCRHLSQVLDQFADGMAFRQGGLIAINKAIKAGVVATAEYSSGLQVSGLFASVIADAMGNPVYLQTEGATQLSYKGEQLSHHGTDAHETGFGSPVGRVQNMTQPLAAYSVDELAERGIRRGAVVTLAFVSGITVSGKLEHIERRDHKNVLFSFTGCSVSDEKGASLFKPEWGRYDMAVGERIQSVFGGAADRALFPLYPTPVKDATDSTPPSMDAVQQIYQQVNEWQWGRAVGTQSVTRIMALLDASPAEWLLRCDLLMSLALDHPAVARLVEDLEKVAQRTGQVGELVTDVLRQYEENKNGVHA